MRLFRPIVFAAAQLVVASPLLLSAETALADPQPTEQAMAEARSRYARGIQLAQDGAFDQAQVELERAYQLWPSYKILYNLGLTKRELGDNVGALTAFEKYLAEGGAEIAAARRTEVEDLVAKLKGRVGSLRIQVSAAGSEILVDDVLVGRAPLDKPVLVNAGRRKVTAIGPLGPVSKLVDVGGQETEDVSFDLPAAPPPERVRDRPTPSRRAAAPSGNSTAMWIGWTATGALAAGAVVTGILGLGASSSLTDAKGAPDPSPDRLSTLASRAKTLALVSDVLTGAAIVAGGISIYLTVRQPSSSPPRTGWVRVQVQGLGMSLQAGF